MDVTKGSVRKLPLKNFFAAVSIPAYREILKIVKENKKFKVDPKNKKR